MDLFPDHVRSSLQLGPPIPYLGLTESGRNTGKHLAMMVGETLQWRRRKKTFALEAQKGEVNSETEGGQADGENVWEIQIGDDVLRGQLGRAEAELHLDSARHRRPRRTWHDLGRTLPRAQRQDMRIESLPGDTLSW